MSVQYCYESRQYQSRLCISHNNAEQKRMATVGKKKKTAVSQIKQDS